MDPQILIGQLKRAQEFFNRSTSELQEKDSELRPAEGMQTAAQQVAHVAQIVDWFMEGAFRPEGFNTDWEAMAKDIMAVTSLTAARESVDRAFGEACASLASMAPADLMQPIADGEIMGGAPRLAAIGGIEDHTAHHRGALTVYARLAGYVPPMPYE